MRRDALTVSMALLLGCGVRAWAEDSAESLPTMVASSNEAGEPEADSTTSARQLVMQFFEAIEDQIAAARDTPPGPTRLEKVRQAEQKIKALAAEDVIRRKVTEVLQTRFHASDKMVNELFDRVVGSWAQILSHYLGQWQLEKMLPVLHGASNKCTVLVPVLDADGRGRTTIQVELVRPTDGGWKVVRVSFADVSVSSHPQSIGAVEREPATGAEER